VLGWIEDRRRVDGRKDERRGLGTKKGVKGQDV